METRHIHIAPSELLVEYFHRGEKHKETIVGTEDEIRGNFVAEGKVVLKISRPSIFMVFGRSKVDSSEVFAVFDTLGDLLMSIIPLSRAIDFVISSFYSKRTTGMKKILNNVSRAVRRDRNSQQHGCLFPSIRQRGRRHDNGRRGSGRLTESLKTSALLYQGAGHDKEGNDQKAHVSSFLLAFGMVALLLKCQCHNPEDHWFRVVFFIPGARENIFIKILKALSYVVPSMLGIIVACIHGCHVKGPAERRLSCAFHAACGEEFFFTGTSTLFSQPCQTHRGGRQD
jgi:hypothetical protein